MSRRWREEGCSLSPGLAPGEAPLEVNIAGPRLQSVSPGDTVTFDCSAKPRVPLQDPMVFGWAKENGLLPGGRSRENGLGLLVISSVETDDSGTYVCTVTAGAFKVEESLQLDVRAEDRGRPGESYGGGRGSSVSISPSWAEAVAGEDAVFDCEDSGGGRVAWSRDGARPLSGRAREQGGRLTFHSVQVSNEAP